jgi:hypothetical protein
LNGLDKDPDLRTSVAQSILDSEAFVTSMQCFCDSLSNPLLAESNRAQQDGNRYIKVVESFKGLIDMATSIVSGVDDFPAWKSMYCMERATVIDRGTTETANRLGHCYVCHGTGLIGKGLKYCSRCLTTLYCCTECRDKDWHSHKKECVKQRRAHSPGNADFGAQLASQMRRCR